MKRTYKYIIALLAVALSLAVASCTKDQPAVTEEGESLRYLTGVTDSTVFYTIDELTDYLAEKSLGDRTGIGKTVLELLYSRSIIKMLERNYLDGRLGGRPGIIAVDAPEDFAE